MTTNRKPRRTFKESFKKQLPLIFFLWMFIKHYNPRLCSVIDTSQA
ncbi:hypothetical protein [Listeria seeligeri]|nr:hypothetical protein [Listeria seeligeri]